MHEEYQRLYYSGIIWERRAHARAIEGSPASKEFAYSWIRQAMDLFERAERRTPLGAERFAATSSRSTRPREERFGLSFARGVGGTSR